ncbi:autoinducer-binding transcriptional regulator TraR [Neorhizobium alkalisoli]|uniref:Transcriptional regulator n=1 Tax=Neorhizobium alkalisoli TaxID=528178 RepID=A0A561PZ96_9HYPH|nr:transcriptional regulator TraR [Neorhizobium alkalisoli]TWF43441.1 transcriptional regulator [Neorhizobium alkalisoli]
MQKLVEKLLDISAITHNEVALKSALADLAGRFDFDGYGYANLRPGEFYAVSNLNAEWQQRYANIDLRRRDPRVQQARRSGQAFAWAAESGQDARSRDGRKFYAEAAEFGIRSGITVPVAISNGAISMLTFASSRSSLKREWKIDAVAAASAVGQLHAHIEHLRVKPSVEALAYLTPKEATYARWLALGKTVEDAADIEQVKYNTVRIALAEVRRRYDLCNNTQLVAFAIRRGMI